MLFYLYAINPNYFLPISANFLSIGLRACLKKPLNPYKSEEKLRLEKYQSLPTFKEVGVE
jgi:hypothetical protein